MITPCPKSPNCVSSVDTDPGHYVRPIEFSGSIEDAYNRLKIVISKNKHARVVTAEESYVHVEFTTRVFRFIDDVEFYFDDHKKIIHVKSASRTGFYDFGVNRRRIESIRKQFDQDLENLDNHSQKGDEHG